MDRKAEQGAAAQGPDSEVARVLRAARARIAQGWCQGTYAKAATGEHVYERDIRACEWCSLGAILASSTPSYTSPPAMPFFTMAIDTAKTASWNDTPGRTQAEVLAAFDRAIALAEAAK